MNSKSSTSAAKQWWRKRRIKYNKGLIAGGFIAFLIYAILGDVVISRYDQEFEVTLLTTLFQGILYLMAMGIANVFYSLGWLIDRSFNTNNSQLFREKLFALGYWFSLLLPSLFISGILVSFLLWH